MEEGTGIGGLIETEKIINETYTEYPEEKKPASFLKFKNILFEKRNALLNESDKFMLSYFPINEINKDKILQYKQDLKDYPQLSFFQNFNGDSGEGENLLPKSNI